MRKQKPSSNEFFQSLVVVHLLLQHNFLYLRPPYNFRFLLISRIVYLAVSQSATFQHLRELQNLFGLLFYYLLLLVDYGLVLLITGANQRLRASVLRATCLGSGLNWYLWACFCRHRRYEVRDGYIFSSWLRFVVFTLLFRTLTEKQRDARNGQEKDAQTYQHGDNFRGVIDNFVRFQSKQIVVRHFSALVCRQRARAAEVILHRC